MANGRVCAFAYIFKSLYIMEDFLTLFGIISYDPDEDDATGGVNDDDENDSDSDTDEKTDDSRGGADTTKTRKTKNQDQFRSRQFVARQVRDSENREAERFEDETGVAPVRFASGKNKGRVDWVSTFQKQRDDNASNQADDDTGDDPKLKAERERRIKAERRAERVAIENAISRATDGIEFATVNGVSARRDAEAGFEKAYQVRTDKRTSVVYLVDNETGEIVYDEDTGKRATVADVFKSFVAERPYFLAPKSNLRARHKAGEDTTGATSQKNSWFSNAIRGR